MGRTRATARSIAILAILLVGAASIHVGPAVAAGVDDANATGEIVRVAPNPVARGDRGEHVVLAFAAPTDLSGWTIEDGETVVRLPNVTVEGRVAITTDPDAALTAERTVVGAGRLALSNAGETIRLVHGHRTVDDVSYENAPEGEHYVRGPDGWRWRPAGATDLPVTSVGSTRVRAFALPDAPDLAVEVLRSGERRVLLAGYTFDSSRVVDALCRARERGVDVDVLLEREPVGGFTTRSAGRLDRLVGCDVDVRLLGGPHARYSFHHAKYAVVDDRALVLSENWKPSGTGGRSNRGWGAVVDSPEVATGLRELFEADSSWLDAGSWEDVRPAEPVEPTGPVATERYPTRFQPTWFVAERVDLLVAPETAEAGVVSLLEDARESIRIQQLSIGGRAHPFVEATLDAARRGVRVRVLLSSASYVRWENEATVEWLNAVAANESLPLEARLVDPRSRFGKVHVKGVVADDAVVVGSLNWNAHATRENREVVVVLYGDVVSAYYARVFDADWRGGVWRVPVGVALVTLLGGLAGAAVTRRWQFAPETHLSPAGADSPGGSATESAVLPWEGTREVEEVDSRDATDRERRF